MDSGYGYINVAGGFVVPPIYHGVTSFSGGRGHVQLDGKVAFVDRHGDEVIARRFGEAKWFHEGLAAVMERDALLVHGPDVSRESAYAARQSKKPMGYIDPMGQYAIEPGFIVAGSFSEGLAAVGYDVDEWGFIDRTGSIRPMGPNCPFDFRDGLCRFEDEDGKDGFVDADLRVVIPPAYVDAFDFHEGLAWC